jgi:signal transduction histidine kinase
MHQSPTPRLLIALAITLLAVAVFSWFSLRQVDLLRQLQSNTIDRHRKDSLQLLRIQNNLNTLGHSLRDMITGESGYPLTAYRGELHRMRLDLEDALHIEDSLALRSPQQRQYLTNSIAQFWRSVDQVFNIASEGDETRARRMIANSLQAQQSALTVTVARLLVANNESEEQAASSVQAIYAQVERNIYLLLAVVVIGILLSSSSVIYYNRQIFNQLENLSEQRSILARQLIGVQEDVLRSLSRELHDEFGQILTAIGTMLGRAEKKGLPPDSPLRADITEVRDIVQETLEKIRSLSQTLHPTVLDDYGLDKAIERFVPMFEKQTGIRIDFAKEGEGEVPDGSAIHVYRIFQEALNNVARHSKSRTAEVRMRYQPDRLSLEIEDQGVGLPENGGRNGLGLIAMRERAELLKGTLTFQRPASGGTKVHLEVPL